MSNPAKSIWFNGKLVPWDQASVHVTCHTLHYGSSVFEGVRAYRRKTAEREDCVFFRLREHTERLFASAKIYRMELPFTPEEIAVAHHTVVAANGLTGGAYIRPIAFRGECGFGVVAKPGSPIETALIAIEWGAYLGAEGLEKGVDVCVSSWQRVAPNTIPAAAKAGGNYLSSQLIGMEAQRLGFHEGIGLATDGSVSEGAGENLFLIKDGKILTPPVAASILGGITRDTLIKLAAVRGLDVIEQAIPREMLYLADELFFTGTAAEVTPVRSVDRIEIGNGGRGPITAQLQADFFGLFDGSTEDRWGWLEPLDASHVAQPVAARG